MWFCFYWIFFPMWIRHFYVEHVRSSCDNWNENRDRSIRSTQQINYCDILLIQSMCGHNNGTCCTVADEKLSNIVDFFSSLVLFYPHSDSFVLINFDRWTGCATDNTFIVSTSFRRPYAHILIHIYLLHVLSWCLKFVCLWVFASQCLKALFSSQHQIQIMNSCNIRLLKWWLFCIFLFVLLHIELLSFCLTIVCLLFCFVRLFVFNELFFSSFVSVSLAFISALDSLRMEDLISTCISFIR